MRGFGMIFDIAFGPLYWYSKEDGIKRWVDNDEPVPDALPEQIAVDMSGDEP